MKHKLGFWRWVLNLPPREVYEDGDFKIETVEMHNMKTHYKVYEWEEIATVHGPIKRWKLIFETADEKAAHVLVDARIKQWRANTVRDGGGYVVRSAKTV